MILYRTLEVKLLSKRGYTSFQNMNDYVWFCNACFGFFYTTCQQYMGELAENRNLNQLFCQLYHITGDNIKGWNNSFFVNNGNCTIKYEMRLRSKLVSSWVQIS
jgi:hypothetical protein